MTEQKLKSLQINRQVDPPINQLSLIWADGKEEVLNFERADDMMKKYMELRDLVPDPKPHDPTAS